MRMTPVALGAVALLAITARADIQIEFPPTVTADTAVIDDLIGVRSYHSPGSKVAVSLPGDGSLRLEWNIAPAAGDEDYAAEGGVLIPILPNGKLFDLSAADSVYFEVKADAATNINFILSSKSLPKAMRDANASVQLMNAYSDPGVEVTTAWQTIGLATSDFVVSFFCSELDNPECYAASTGVNWTTAGKRVEAIIIQPILIWKNATTIAKNASGSVILRNFRLTNVSKYPRPDGQHCTGSTFYQLDDFGGKTPGQSREGGFWFANTDSSTTNPDAETTGASRLILPGNEAKWSVTSRGAILNATLEKNVGSRFHKNAGWTSVGMNFAEFHWDPVFPVSYDWAHTWKYLSFEKMSAISFDFYTGSSIDSSYRFDSKLVPVIRFKANAYASDHFCYSFYIDVPTQAGNGSRICVDLDMLQPPDSVMELVDFYPPEMTQLAWEMKIEDQKDSATHTSGPSALMINNVKLWGVDSGTATGIHDFGHARNGFNAMYGKNLTVSYKVTGPASVSVVRLDGSVVASFKTAAVANNLNLPVSLTRGTYMVVVRGDKAGALVRRIAVSR